MILFENHIRKIDSAFPADGWKQTIDDIWKNRFSFGLEYDTKYKFNRDAKQLLLDIRKDESLKAGKYCGVIRSGEEEISIIPKIFHSNKTGKLVNENPDLMLKQVHAHILWWMSYGSKIRLPKSFASFATQNSSLLEILIYFYAYYTEELLNSYVFNDYHLNEDDLSLVRGRIKFNEYAGHASRGNWHIVPCEFSEYQMDNELNQIIRYVTGLLIDVSREKQTKKLLEKILDRLSGVTYRKFEAEDCEHVLLNPLFEEYHIVLDYCKMFLSNSQVSAANDKVSVFSFLVNTASLYENFLQGFLIRNKNELGISKVSKATSTLGALTVTGKGKFGVEFDFKISMTDGRDILADAKYKRIYKKERGDDKSKNFGIGNSDVFQMMSYSQRTGIQQLHLFYPKYMVHGESVLTHRFNMYDSPLTANTQLSAEGLDICNYNIADFSEGKELSDYFEETEKNLLKQLKNILNPSEKNR